jgi:hypothetical protein
LLFWWKIISYSRFRLYLNRTSSLIDDEPTLALFRRQLQAFGIKKPIALYGNSLVSAPVLVGLQRTAVVLPNIKWVQSELDFVLRHELTHHRHRDLWIKWFGTIVCALHWFNPCVWLLMRELNRWMEFSCDAAVVRTMSDRQRREYGMAILSVLGRIQLFQGQGICAALCEQKENMKERLTKMLNTKKTSKKARTLSIAALVLLCAAGMLMGAAAYSPAEPDLQPLPQNNAEPLTKDPVEGDISVPDTPDLTKNDMSESDAMSFLWPLKDVDYISAGLDGYPGHTGIDIPRPKGTEIYASAAGIVTLAKEQYTGYGNYIVIDHANGYQTLYAQCDELLVALGDEVTAGQIIAKVGRSGSATGYHLHFEIRCDGDILDPEDYMTPDNE